MQLRIRSELVHLQPNAQVLEFGRAGHANFFRVTHTIKNFFMTYCIFVASPNTSHFLLILSRVSFIYCICFCIIGAVTRSANDDAYAQLYMTKCMKNWYFLCFEVLSITSGSARGRTLGVVM